LLAALVGLIPALAALRNGPPARAATTYTVTRTVATAANPNGVVLDPARGRQFVQNAILSGGPPSIGVVSDAAGAVTATYPTAQVPVEMAYDGATDLLYVVERRNGPPSETPTTSLFFSAAPLSSIAVAQIGEVHGGRVEVFGASTGDVMQTNQLPGYLPTSLAKDPLADRLVIGQTADAAAGFGGSPGIIILDLPTNEIVRSLQTPGPPTGVVVDPTRGRIYVTSTNPLSSDLLPLGGTLTVFDESLEAVTVAQITVGADPGDVALDVPARRAYVANRGAGGSVSVVNLDTNQVVRTVGVPGAQQVGVDPGSEVYVTGFERNNVSVRRAGDLALLATVPVANTPDGVAVDPVAHRAYVTTFNVGRLVTISRRSTTDPTTTVPRPVTTFPPPATTIPVVVMVAPTTRPPSTTTVAPPPPTAPATTVAPDIPPPPRPPPRPTTTLARSQQAAAQFVDAVPSPLETRTSLAELTQDAFLTIVFLALLSLPINVVNGVAETNAEVLAARTAGIGQRFRGRGAGGWVGGLPLAPVLVVAALVSAVLYGFLQPSFGFDESSLALVLGVALAVLVLNSVQRLSQIAYLSRAFNTGAFLRLLPGFAVVALGCVAVSRLIGLQPGLLLGPLATVGLRQQLPQEDQGKALAVSYTSVAVLALVAWFSRSSVLGLFDAATLPGEVFGVAWTTVVVAATETVAFNMIPLRFLDGYQVFKWSKAAWAGLAIFGLYGFVHVLINPTSGGGGFEGRTTYLGILLVVYLALAAGFWAYFHIRTEAARAEPPPQPPDVAPSPPSGSPPSGADSMQAAWRAMQGSGWPAPRP